MVGTAVPARAQIYTWRDAEGRLMLSNVRPDGAASVQAYAVPGTEPVRTAREVSDARPTPYDDLIVEHSRRHNVRASLVRAVIQVESAFNPWAVSDKGAM